jgi:hypothetical protein
MYIGRKEAERMGSDFPFEISFTDPQPMPMDHNLPIIFALISH